MSDLRPVSFMVPGEPVGKGRHKTSTRVVGGKAFTRHYTPAKTVSYEKHVALCATAAMGGRELIGGPVLIELKIIMPIAVSWAKSKKAEALKGEVLPTKKPDSSNILKAIEDALNGVIWIDDVQAVKHFIDRKFGTVPGVYVRVVPLVGKRS